MVKYIFKVKVIALPRRVKGELKKTPKDDWLHSKMEITPQRSNHQRR